jgi:hypothetical protein
MVASTIFNNLTIKNNMKNVLPYIIVILFFAAIIYLSILVNR